MKKCKGKGNVNKQKEIGNVKKSQVKEKVKKSKGNENLRKGNGKGKVRKSKGKGNVKQNRKYREYRFSTFANEPYHQYHHVCCPLQVPLFQKHFACYSKNLSKKQKEDIQE